MTSISKKRGCRNVWINILCIQFLSIITQVTAIDNSTRHVNGKPVLVDFVRPNRVCPESYRLLPLNKDRVPAYFICGPQSCTTLINTTADASRDFSENDGTIDKTDKDVYCKVFAKEFFYCSKENLNFTDYKVDKTSGLLTILKDGSTREMGNYFIHKNKAMVCTEKINKTEVIETPKHCLPLPFSKDHFAISQDGTLTLLDGSNVTVSSMYYSILASNGSRIIDATKVKFQTLISATAYICLKISKDMFNCDFSSYSTPKIKILPNFSLWATENLQDVVYPAGDYLLAEDTSEATVCYDPANFKNRNAYLLYVYAIYGMNSVFYSLTLLVYVLLPKLNVQWKPILCMLTGAAVGNIIWTARFSLTLVASKFVNYLVYIGSLFSDLSALCWLNVYCFMVWNTLSHFMENSNANRSMSDSNNRSFIFQSIYACGVPILLCTFILIVDQNKSWQPALRSQIDIESMHSDGLIATCLDWLPMILNMLNVAFFVMTIMSIRKTNSETKMVNGKAARNQIVLFVKIFMAMDGSWLLSQSIYLVGMYDPTGIAEYVVTSIDGFRAVFLFWVLVCNKRAFEEIKKKLEQWKIACKCR